MTRTEYRAARFNRRVETVIQCAMRRFERDEDLTPFAAVQGLDTSAAVLAEAVRRIEG